MPRIYDPFVETDKAARNVGSSLYMTENDGETDEPLLILVARGESATRLYRATRALADIDADVRSRERV